MSIKVIMTAMDFFGIGLDPPPAPCEMPISTFETSSKIWIIDSRVLRRELLVSYFEKRTRIIPLNFGPRDETEKLSHYISRFATRSKRFSCYFPYMYRVTQKKDTDVLHRGVARYCVVLHSIEWYCMELHSKVWYCMVLTCIDTIEVILSDWHYTAVYCCLAEWKLNKLTKLRRWTSQSQVRFRSKKFGPNSGYPDKSLQFAHSSC